MRRYFLFILCLFPFVTAFSQQLKLEITGYDARCYHSSGGTFSFNVHLDAAGVMQGPVEIYEMLYGKKKDSVLVFKGTVLDGNFVELATWYYPSGRLKRRTNFSRTKPEGWAEKECRYDIGDLQICGKVEGTLLEWYDKMKDTTQQIKAIFHYTGGKENGVQQYYYESGLLEREWNMVMGQWDGKFTGWYRNGKIEEEGNYKAGFRSGPWKEYWENGNLRQTKATNGGDDTIVNYYKSGKIKNRTYYQDGDRHGDYFAYDTLGKVQTYKHFNKGERDSVQVSYYPSGAKSELIRFNGKGKEGTYQAWYPNGKLKLKGQHIDGEPSGIWKKYDETGKETGLIHYSEVWRETKAFSDSDLNEIGETAQEMFSFDFVFTRPTIQNADQPLTVLKEDKLKFLQKLNSLDALAVMDTYGKISFRVLTPLKPEDKEKLENYLNLHYGTGRPMTYAYGKSIPNTMTVKIVIGH